MQGRGAVQGGATPSRLHTELFAGPEPAPPRALGSLGPSRLQDTPARRGVTERLAGPVLLGAAPAPPHRCPRLCPAGAEPAAPRITLIVGLMLVAVALGTVSYAYR